MRQRARHSNSKRYKTLFICVVVLFIVIGTFLVNKRSDLPKIIRNTKIVLSGNGEVHIIESLEVDPDLDVYVNSLGGLSTTPMRISNLKINHYPISTNEFIQRHEKYNGKKINFFSLVSPLTHYTKGDMGVLISWDINHNVFSNYQKTMINTFKAIPLFFVKPALIVSKRAKILENIQFEIRESNLLLGPIGLPSSSKPVFRNFKNTKYFHEYIQETTENKKLTITREPYIILVNTDSTLEHYELRKAIIIESPDQIRESNKMILKISGNEPFGLERHTNYKLDLTNPDVKVYIDGNQPNVVPLDDSTVAKFREGDYLDVKLFSYYYGKNSVSFDRKGKSITIFYPSNPNKIIKTTLDICYNPQKINEVVKLDEFNYKMTSDIGFDPNFRRKDDIVSIEIPKDYRFGSHNYSDALINESENKLVFKGLNKLENTIIPLEIYFSRRGVEMLNFLKYLNIIFSISSIIVFIYKFLNRNVPNIFIGSIILGLSIVINLALSVFYVELFIASLFYTFSFLLLIPLIVVFYFKFFGKSQISQ